MAQDIIEINLYEDVVMGAVKIVRQTFRVALPGIVRSFARDTSRVGVSLVTRFIGTDLKPREEPPVQDVPVILPRGDGYGIHFDLVPGDPTVILCADGPVRSYYEQGEIVTPTITTGHQFGTSVAFPGGRVSSSLPGQATPPPNEPGAFWAGAEDGSSTVRFYKKGQSSNPTELGSMILAVGKPTDSLLLGSDSSGDPVACEPAVLANLEALANAIAVWVPVPQDGGASLKAVFTAWKEALQPMGDLKARVDGPIPLPP